ncbi:hypothetical protein CH063_15329, partial [Colletotrichum higginsianum]
LELLLVGRRVEPHDEGRRGEGGDERHDDEHGEGPRAEDLGLEANVQHDELDEPLAGHEGADGEGLAPHEAVHAGAGGAADDLGEEGDEDDGDDVPPRLAAVEQAQVRVDAGQREEERDEEGGDEVLDLLRQLDGEAALVRAHEADHEGAKDAVDADDGGEEGRGEHHDERQRHDPLRRPVLEAARAPEHPHEARADGVGEEEGEADGDEEDPDGGDAGARVDEGDAEREEHPADDVVGDARREHDDADGRVEELEGRQDAAEHGECLVMC